MPGTEQETRYREIRRLGAGGMAKVTLADDTVLGRQVALKRVYATGDPQGILRLKREALVGASLNHPNLVFVYDAHLQDDGDVVIVMEYVEGETLADLISARGALPPDEAIRVLRGVATALDAIHQQGIVHRDVKPANVLLGRDGAVKLADLGVADVADRTHITSSGAVVGSFSYMAAEQLEGATPSRAMDVYALAAVAFEILTGQKARPQSNPLALAHAISTQPPPDLRAAWPAAPAEAAEVLRRGMSADPGMRPGSAGELVRRLESAFAPAHATEAAPVAVAPPPRTDRPPPRPDRPPLRADRPPPRAERPPPRTDRPPPRTDRPPPRTDRPPPRGERERRAVMVPALLALAALAVAGLVVAILTSGGAGKKPAGTATTTAHRTSHQPSTSQRPSTTGSTSSSATPPATGATSSTAAPATTTAAPATTTAAPTTTASSTPASAVEQFYTDAATHQYPQAWALADQNLRNELGGYAGFQNLMSSVRSITFHRAATAAGSTSSTATVALQTTSVQTNRTQQCTGTARTVRAGGGWLVDGVSIRCS
jgi:serine/threonine protein kinase